MEHLTEVILSLSKFLDNRTAMMQAMYKEDVHRDFLMKEKLQSIDETGGVKVQPVSSPGIDLSPVNELLPQVSAKRARKQPLVKAATGLLGGADVSNALTVNATSMGTEPMAQPKTSLAKVGLEDGIKKNISKDIEDDFVVDDKLKKAFGETLALPAKAAAVALLDLMSKIPAASQTSAQAIKDNIQNISAAFRLDPINYEMGTDADQTDDAKDGKDGKDGKGGLLENLISLVGGAAGGAMGGGAQKGGALALAPQMQGDPPNLQTNYSPKMPYTGTADGIGLGDGSGRSMQPVKARKPTLKSSLMMSPMGMSIMGGQKILEGAKSFSKSTAFNNITNMSKQALSLTPMGMMANLGMNAFGSVTNTYNSNGDRITNISELTDKVIDENRESAKAKTDIASASLISAANSQMSIPSLKQPAMQGGAKAVPKTVESPYLSVYNKTSQF
tara:strand:+ start:647 stop:1984 length:1338 start_codon:yes stop_codon:yes gene_type:complete